MMTIKDRTRRAMEVAAKLPPLGERGLRRRQAQRLDRRAAIDAAREKLTGPGRLRST